MLAPATLPSSSSSTSDVVLSGKGMGEPNRYRTRPQFREAARNYLNFFRSLRKDYGKAYWRRYGPPHMSELASMRMAMVKLDMVKRKDVDLLFSSLAVAFHKVESPREAVIRRLLRQELKAQVVDGSDLSLFKGLILCSLANDSLFVRSADPPRPPSSQAPLLDPSRGARQVAREPEADPHWAA